MIVPTVPNENDDGSCMPNESDDGSCVEILDSGSDGGDVDMISEDELTRFSEFLFEAQQKALAVRSASWLRIESQRDTASSFPSY